MELTNPSSGLLLLITIAGIVISTNVDRRCYGVDNDCCTESNPCTLEDGDCDNSDQCSGALVCGDDNCSPQPPFDDSDDCCVKPSVPICGETVDSGTITHPLDGYYQNFEDCLWNIQVYSPYVLRFTKMSLEYCSSWGCDYVQIANGEKHCGGNLPPDQLHSGPTTLYFHSDAGAVYGGFRVEIAPCPPSCLHGGRCIYPGICDCKKGWNGRQCGDDVDECLTNNGGCTQICSNTPGSFNCQCKRGYQLEKDQKSCRELRYTVKVVVPEEWKQKRKQRRDRELKVDL